MTLEKLNEVLLLINDLYPYRAPAITERVVDVWDKCFSEYNDQIVDKAVMDAVKECKYPPTINDLVIYCDKYKKEHDDRIVEIKAIYKEILDLCDRNENRPEVWEAYRNCIKHEDLKVSAKRACDLELRFMAMYRNRLYGAKLPPLKEWIEAQTWEQG